jgi:hypothetical protein
MAFDATFTAHTIDTDETDSLSCWREPDEDEYAGGRLPRRKANRERRAQAHPARSPQEKAHDQWPDRARRGPTRAARHGTEEFKCRHCRAFIGPTVGGGRHRNHCPFCLHSRHVDDRRPGDRASDCGATMAPVARFDRPGGEPVIIHRCLGCGLERHNRLAADDSIMLLTRLPLVAPRLGQRVPSVGEEVGQEREERVS